MKRKEWKRLLTLPFIISFVIYDIWIVEGLFATLQIWESIYVYHQATYCFLVPVLILLIGLGLKSWRFSMYSTVGVYCGWLDILYFLFQDKALPTVYGWLPLSPTSVQLIALAISTLIIALFVDFRERVAQKLSSIYLNLISRP